MSFAMSAAPLVVRLPATAQLLLPAAGPGNGAAGEAPEPAAVAHVQHRRIRYRRSERRRGGGRGVTGASQLVPSG